MKGFYIFIILLSLFISGCKKADDDSIGEIPKDSVWITESFKSNYTIQFPDSYEGIGMYGFEGNMFTKNRIDEKVLFSYQYCHSLGCENFGDTLESPIPNSIIAIDANENEVFLDLVKLIFEESDTVGILYYNDEEQSTGKYFMKEGDELLEGLSVYFTKSEFSEVEEIILSINEI